MYKCKKCGKNIQHEFEKCKKFGKSFINEIYFMCSKENPTKIFKKINNKKDLEFSICKKINNLNLEFLLTYYDSNNEGIIYNYIEGETLEDFLMYQQNINLIYKIFKKLFNNLLELEKLNLNHFDISSKNIIIDKNNNPFIIDYSYLVKKNEINLLPKFIGSYGFVPFEYIKYKKIVFNKFDIFSFGILLFEALFRFKLFSGGSNYSKKCWVFCKKEDCNRSTCLQNYIDKNLSKEISKDFYLFFYYCLIYSLKENSDERLSFTQLNDLINMNSLSI